MFEAFFGLSRRPFSATPDPNCFLSLDATQAALDELVVCVERGQGIAILTGPAGTGKTLICERLLQELGDNLCKVYLRHSNLPTRRALLQSILYELRYPYSRMTEQELRLELTTLLRTLHSRKQAVALICDEAHQLADSLLEELRIVTDVAEAGVPIVRLVLSGHVSLEERLAQPQFESLNQRVRAHVCLEPFSRQDSLAYVAYRIREAGGELSDIFTPEALDLIAQISDGVPRCLNQLCDHALLLAYVAEERPVGAETVRAALDDLKQLPLHWNEPATLSHAAEPMPPVTAVCHDSGAVHYEVATESIEIGGDANTESVSVEAEPISSVVAASPVAETHCCQTEVSCVPSAEPVSQSLQEEFVYDRYAALDAGLTPLPITSASISTAEQLPVEATDPPEAVPTSASAVETPEPAAEIRDLFERHRPDQAIDRMLPWLDAAVSTDDEAYPVRYDDVFISADASEQEIGESVVDLCWQTQQSLQERSPEEPVITRPEPAAPTLRGPMLPAVEYDTVEPVGRSRHSDTTESERRARSDEPPREAGRYRNLFSRLRRRQQEMQRTL